MPFVVGEQVGAYRIVEQLGQGGMSTVYKAYHAALDRYVALKVLHAMFKGDRGFLERFQREARIVARLEHPNIVPVYDFSEHEGIPYLVMRYVEGRTLKAVLNEESPLSLARIVTILRPVGEALEYAHGLGVLHRDIKPSNVLLSLEGKVYVTDFGLAKMVQTGDSTISQDRMIGTPQYLSPEQAKGETLDHRTDLYSLGVVLFEMVTGRVPYTADTPIAVVHDHIFSPLPLPSQVNPAVAQPVEQVILKALAKVPADRYQRAGELVQALESAVQSVGESLMVAPGQAAVAVPGAEPVPSPVTIPLADAGPAEPASVPSELPSAPVSQGEAVPSTVAIPLVGAAPTEPVPAPSGQPPVETPAPGSVSEKEARAPAAGLGATVSAAVSAGLAEAEPALDQVRDDVAAGLAQAAQAIQDARVAPAPPPPAAAKKRVAVRWPVWVGIVAAIVVGVSLLAWFVVVPVLKQRAQSRSATATALGVAPTPQPPPLGEAQEPYPIRVEERYVPPGALSVDEGEAQLRLLDETISRDPRQAALHLERGNVFFLIRHFGEAEEAYRQVLALDPEMPWAHYNHGVTLIYLQRPEEALREFQWVLDRAGDRVAAPVFYNLGLAHVLLGHRLEAVNALREFLRLQPEEDMWRGRAQDLLRRLGE